MREPSEIETLNTQFEIPGVARLHFGNGGLTKLRVETPLAAAEIYLHGAQVTSWQPLGAEEAIFLSEHSHWRNGRAIRGGVPICFPWFRGKADNAQAPAHGFVRTKEWQLDSVTAGERGNVVAVFSTGSDETTRRWWPYDFSLQHRVTVGAELRMELIVRNTGSTSFTFEEALHTYFRVSDAAHVSVCGLDQVSYLDNTDGNREKTQTGDVRFERAMDNAYLETASPCELTDPILKQAIRTEKFNSRTTVIWNPWQEGAAALSDLGDDEWRRMACVEACNIRDAAITLTPGGEHTMRATLSVIAD